MSTSFVRRNPLVPHSVATHSHQYCVVSDQQNSRPVPPRQAARNLGCSEHTHSISDRHDVSVQIDPGRPVFEQKLDTGVRHSNQSCGVQRFRTTDVRASRLQVDDTQSLPAKHRDGIGDLQKAKFVVLSYRLVSLNATLADRRSPDLPRGGALSFQPERVGTTSSVVRHVPSKPARGRTTSDCRVVRSAMDVHRQPDPPPRLPTHVSVTSAAASAYSQAYSDHSPIVSDSRSMAPYAAGFQSTHNQANRNAQHPASAPLSKVHDTAAAARRHRARSRHPSPAGPMSLAYAPTFAVDSHSQPDPRNLLAPAHASTASNQSRSGYWAAVRSHTAPPFAAPPAVHPQPRTQPSVNSSLPYHSATLGMRTINRRCIYGTPSLGPPAARPTAIVEASSRQAYVDPAPPPSDASATGVGRGRAPSMEPRPLRPLERPLPRAGPAEW